VSRSYGETWVYESLVGGIPGLAVPRTLAVAIQFLLFEVGVLVLGWYYGLWNAVIAGTAAVLVAAGSLAFAVRTSSLSVSNIVTSVGGRQRCYRRRQRLNNSDATPSGVAGCRCERARDGTHRSYANLTAGRA